MKTLIKNKVSKVKVLKKVCETSRGFSFSLQINGVDATGFFRPISSGINGGADCNELEVVIDGKKKNIKISTGGGYRYYELALYGRDFIKKENQKDFQFTGAYYQIVPLQNTIKDKFISILSNPEAKLTDEFKSVFGI